MKKNYTREELDAAFACAIDAFDFAKIDRIMNFLDWKWVRHDLDGNICYRVPEYMDLVEMTLDLSTYVIDKLMTGDYDENSEYITNASGGFEVYFYLEDEMFEIKFVVEESSYEVEREKSVASSGNVFADLACANPEQLKAMADCYITLKAFFEPNRDK